MDAFEILIVFGDVACKANIVDKGNNLYQIIMSDTPIGHIKKGIGVWRIEGDIASIITYSDVETIRTEIELQYFNSLCNMFEYCSLCSPFKDKCDIDLFALALNLEPDHSENFICTGCNNRAVYKDDKGLLYLAKQEGKEIKLYPVNLDELLK